MSEILEEETLEKVEEEKLLVIHNLKKKYLNAKRYSINDLTLELKAGEIFGFLGQNGAGKSTTRESVAGAAQILMK